MEQLRKIELLYDVIDKSNNKIETITNLLNHYISEEADVNEYKTVLIISNDFIENRFIYYLREVLTTKMNIELRTKTNT